MFKLGLLAGALAAAFTIVLPAPSQASSGKSGQSCQAKCEGKGLMGGSASTCTQKCEAKRGGYSRTH
jgi:hypothetical protein